MGLFSKKEEKKPQSDDYERPPAELPPTYNESQQQQWGGHVEEEAPQYSGNYGPNEYPPEKGQQQPPSGYGPNEYPPEKTQDAPGYQPPPPSGYGPQSTTVNQNWSNPSPHFSGGPPQGSQGPPPGTYTVPANTYSVRPNTVNIANDSGKYTRPEYQEYLKRDQERMAQGNYPKPREAFKHGAPLDPGHVGSSKSGFPGRSGATYHNAANR